MLDSANIDAESDIYNVYDMSRKKNINREHDSYKNYPLSVS